MCFTLDCPINGKLLFSHAEPDRRPLRTGSPAAQNAERRASFECALHSIHRLGTKCLFFFTSNFELRTSNCIGFVRCRTQNARDIQSLVLTYPTLDLLHPAERSQVHQRFQSCANLSNVLYYGPISFLTNDSRSP